jgi:hypothetical protein
MDCQIFVQSLEAHGEIVMRNLFLSGFRVFLFFDLFVMPLIAEIQCPSCHSKNNDEDRYCLECGKELRELTAAEKEKMQAAETLYQKRKTEAEQLYFSDQRKKLNRELQQLELEKQKKEEEEKKKQERDKIRAGFVIPEWVKSYFGITELPQWIDTQGKYQQWLRQQREIRNRH